MIDATVKVEGDHMVVMFVSNQEGVYEDMRAIRYASYGVTQRGRYNFTPSDEEIARELDPDHWNRMRRSDKGDHKPEKFVEHVCRIKVIV